MNNEVNEMKNTEITIASLFDVLRKFFWIIAIFSVLAGAVMGVYSAVFVETKYTASAKFTIVNMLSNNEYIADTMINAASDIADIFVEIADENIAVGAAVDAGKLDEYFGCTKLEAIKKVSSMISARKESAESPIFTITATSTNKNDVYVVITALQMIVPDVVKQLNTIEEGDKVTTTAKAVSTITLVDQVSEVNPSTVRNVLVGTMAAFLITYFICLVIYICDTKVYDEHTIKNNFDAPVIGLIPKWGEEKKSISLSVRDYSDKVLNESTPFAVSEAFNTLRTNICYCAVNSKCPVYAVTSDFSGAGKSVVSVNLARSLSMLGKKTLLIECDLRCPKMNRIFKTDVKVGLSELLSGVDTDLETVVKKSDNPNLDVIYSGHTPPNPSLLLGSDNMRVLIEKFKESYDAIILDTPPAFEVADVCAVAPIIDGTVIVARSEHSDVGAIKEVIELINGVEGRILGFVVNAIDLKLSGTYRSRYGNYGKYRKYAKYSYYASQDEIKK